jgi:Uma2 family endonuclease
MATRLRPPPLISYDEYLVMERDMQCRHEYADGAIRMMIGATLAHGVITANLIRELGNRLREGPCMVVEALSESTARIDQREKARAYLSIVSLRYYLIVDPWQRTVDIWARSNGEWTLMAFGELPLPDLDISIPVASIFEKAPREQRRG